MKAGKKNDWQGRLQPKRETCPECGKKGLGPIKMLQGPYGMVPGKECRYCTITILSKPTC